MIFSVKNLYSQCNILHRVVTIIELRYLLKYWIKHAHRDKQAQYRKQSHVHYVYRKGMDIRDGTPSFCAKQGIPLSSFGMHILLKERFKSSSILSHLTHYLNLKG